jgi:hypothetical protein
MFGKFPQNATLTALAAALKAAREALSSAQHAYAEAVSEIVHARAEVRWADYRADKGVRKTLRAAEDADGNKNGRIAAMVLPDGITPIIKPVGATQVKAMRELEGRLEAGAGTWDGALTQKGEITGLRTDYEAALQARQSAGQKASDKKAARDAAKEDYLDVYAEVGARVKAEFPRDKRMQDLFFDTVWEDDSGVEDAGDEEDIVQAPATPDGSAEGGAKPA